VHFKPKNTLRQRLVHPKDKTPKQKLRGVVYAVQGSEERADLYIGETNSSTSEWHNIGELPLQVKTQQCTDISRKRDTVLNTLMYTFWTEKTGGLREESRKPSMLDWKNYL